MDESTHDPILTRIMMDQLVKKCIPRALRLKDRVYCGERLNDFDIIFLNDTLTDITSIKPIADRNPDYRQVVLRMVQLCKDISDKALENETRHHKPHG
ncbi:hypothetical protein HBA55_25310 [Pseudomaricurvus alkylphenolicus]|uniref:hypothetical protein n=1 Tax=Pseudomaricurvus alkylphenolicus TaxID=1306991 RepID=UPI001422985B|nr:hypothetical protein [Pseudomaricurvus alkylphenolicus]NIB42951.1 hypothetical protein [Pseudomaricurvus alkylphenolicus]